MKTVNIHGRKKRRLSEWLIGVGILSMATLGFQRGSSASDAASSLVLYNGESTYSSGESTTDCIVSEKCFKALPTIWHSPILRIQSGSVNLEKYKFLEFYIKSTDPTASLQISLSTWPNTSLPVNIKNHLEPGVDITQFQRVVIPISEFITNQVNLGRAYYFAFNKLQSSTKKYTFNVDQMIAHVENPIVQIPEEPTPQTPHADVIDPALLQLYLDARSPFKTKFGCELGDEQCAGSTLPAACTVSSNGVWPNNAKTATTPLAFYYSRGPYLNKAGYDNVKEVNAMHTRKETLGLKKEKFRSYDALLTVPATGPAYYKAHSTVIANAYPQLELKNELPYMDRLCTIIYNGTSKVYENQCQAINADRRCDTVFNDKINYGVRSLAASTNAYGSVTSLLNVIDYEQKNRIRGKYLYSTYAPGTYPYSDFSISVMRRNLDKGETQAMFKKFYENNFLFVTPGVRSFSKGDAFAYLSPMYLFSDGASGSDSALLSPILRASASIPSSVKDRILEKRLLVPTLMYLFKSSYSENYASQEAHKAAYKLPDEASDRPLVAAPGEARSVPYENAAYEPAPLLEEMIDRAKKLSHIPPVARLKVLDVKTTQPTDRTYYIPTFYENSTYNFTGALRKGESMELIIDLWDSWVDTDKSIQSFHSAMLRGAGEVIPLTADGSMVKVIIPYMTKPDVMDSRSDILFYINDGTYDSAPAYISIKHIQTSEEGYYFK